jgi:hypothetical protein
MEFDLKIENIPFLVDERNHNIDKIQACWKKMDYWRKTYMKTSWSKKTVDVKTLSNDYKIIITDLTNKIADLTIRNMKIDDLIWQKNLMLNHS